MFGLMLLLLGQNSQAITAQNQTALLVEIHGEIDAPLASYLNNRIKRAETDGVALLILDVDTPGGRLDSAIEMSDKIINTTVPTLAVVQNAFSAGALIAMSAEQVAMLPASEIGAALPIMGNGQEIVGAVGEKINSAVRTKFRSVAKARGRNQDAAEGMVNPNKEIPGLKKKSEILTLVAGDAVKNKIADFEATNLEDAMRQAGFAKLTVVRSERSSAELVGAFLTQPIVAAILIGLGIIGLVLEFLHPGLTAPGILGVTALAAYFGGGFLTGGGNSIAFLLFLAGLMLLVAEIFLIPGFGVAGIGGVASLLASIYLSFGDQFLTVSSISVLVAGAGLALGFWLLPRTSATRPIFLNASLKGNTAAGEMPQLRGRYGVALSDLRPSGVADVEGERMDVVSDGDFISAGTRLEVVRVEGRRIVVKKMGQ